MINTATRYRVSRILQIEGMFLMLPILCHFIFWERTKFNWLAINLLVWRNASFSKRWFWYCRCFYTNIVVPYRFIKFLLLFLEGHLQCTKGLIYTLFLVFVYRKILRASELSISSFFRVLSLPFSSIFFYRTFHDFNFTI